MSQRRVQISDFAEVITGGTPSTTNPEYWDNGDIPWLQSGACQNSIISGCDTFITQKGLDNSAAKMMKSDSVLIALTGATTGKVGYLTFEACANQSVTGIQPNAQYVSKYLFYYLKGIRQRILDDSYGGAQKHISQGYVKNIEVPLGTISEQAKIAKILEQVDGVIAARQQQLQTLDDLIKARFVEMFEGNYPTVTLGDVIKTTSGGTPSKAHPEYYEGGTIPWLTSGEINSGVISSVKNRITESGMNNSSAKMIPENSVVVAMYGATAGVTGILRVKTTTNQAVCSLLPTKRFIPEYLYYAVASKKAWMISQCQGGGQPNISQGIIKSMDLLDPPIGVQKSFATFVTQVDKLKVAVQKALDEAQVLFESLMQQCFEVL